MSEHYVKATCRTNRYVCVCISQYLDYDIIMTTIFTPEGSDSKQVSKTQCMLCGAIIKVDQTHTRPNIKETLLQWPPFDLDTSKEARHDTGT